MLVTRHLRLGDNHPDEQRREKGNCFAECLRGADADLILLREPVRRHLNRIRSPIQ